MKTKLLDSTLLLAAVFTTSVADAADPSSYAREIRPLLAAKCLACHGPDDEHREADLRLDDRESAIESAALEPGKPDESELIRRILSDDPDEQMPPPDSGESLSDAEKQLLQKWVREGAEYTPHWAFQPPSKPAVPKTPFDDRVQNAIDAFVFHRLAKEGLKPSPRADKYSLVRRLYIDLTGLPPTPEQADAFVSDSSSDAYEKLVDSLLASDRYGERWARLWLDLARYADTNGYEKDRPRTIWPYRDWVIRALNDDMPYHQFTIEQLAGDMLPDATVEQRIATGFHRNTMLNEEGGIDPLEYRFYAMVDRVATTGTVWMGLTTGCAQCHSHKYDPISHTDYYSLMALLNNADEPDLTIEDQANRSARTQVQKQIEDLTAQLEQQFPAPKGEGPEAERRKQHLENQFRSWLKVESEQGTDWQILKPASATSNLPRLEILKDGSVFSSGDITKRDVFQISIPISEEQLPLTAIRLEVLPDIRLPAGGPGRAYYEGRKGDFFLSELSLSLHDEKQPFASGSVDYGKISIGSGKALAENVYDSDGSTGWSTSGREGQASQMVLNLKTPIRKAGDLQIEMLFERHFAASLGRFRFSSASTETPAKASQHPVAIEALLARPNDSLTESETSRLLSQFLLTTPELEASQKKIQELQKRIPSRPFTMVMLERPSDNIRPTFRHHRGEYLSPREPVEPAVPGVFSELTSKPPRNRLEFAQWLVSSQNPLVARVTVDRQWQAFFGTGMVNSSGDFGTQAELPSHPELLDWLSVEFVDQGWSLKKLHKLIVMSETYQQSSDVNLELLKADPENRLLSRGARFRVPAEMVRDVLLSASGLLSDKMYGPGVYPPQPASVTALAYGNTKWNTSKGEDRHRRSLYTFIKRTAPFAAFTVFDAPTGESCVAKRNRSNTPLQALTLLNDEMFLEMARKLGQETASLASNSTDERTTLLFRRLMTRPPTDSELASISAFYKSQKARLDSGELKASEIEATQKPSSESAAWTLVARALMNLDEAVTRH